MRRFIFAIIVLPSMLALLLGPVGCARKPAEDEYDDSQYRSRRRPASSTKRDGGGKSALPSKEPLVKVDSLDGTVTGTVVYEGTPPAEVLNPPLIDAIQDLSNPADKKCCLLTAPKEDKVEQTWFVKKVGDEYRVANAVVYLQVVNPAKNYLPAKPERIKEGKVVKLEQPHCAFNPHALAIFPEYFDGKKKVRTSDKFLVTNTSTITHNTKTSATNYNEAKNVTIPPGSDEGRELEFNADTQPIRTECSIHPWMRANIWAFAHPYYAVTDGEGKFKIENVPTGAEVQVIGWHEATDNFFKEKKTFKKGDNELKMSVKR